MARAPGGFRRRALLLAAVATLALIVATIALHGARAATPRHGPNQTRLILRLHDLPLGYLNVELQEEQGERIFCSPLTHPNDTPPRMVRFVVRFRPKGCIGAYYRFFTVPGQPSGPVLAGTGVLSMSSGQAANAAWNVVPELLGRLMNDHQPRQVAVPEKVGSATKLFHTNDPPRFYPIYGKIGPTASFLVWRSGNTLAVVMAIGQSFAEDDRAAVELARRQQAHIRRPTRYTRAERFDGEVPLDDPALETPVYWLGRNFRPGNGLPSNRLFDAYAPAATESSEEAPGAALRMRYYNFHLDSWTQASWPRYSSTPMAQAVTTWHCTETQTVALPEGTATVYGGYTKNFKRCPDRAPDVFTARAYLGEMIVVIESPICPGCIESTPYDSFAGMEAIVHGLRLRPKPVY